MRSYDTTIPVDNGLCVLSGYGVKLHVKHDRLHAEDGACEKRRFTTFSRATCNIKQIVVISSDGYVSLDALQWLHDVGAGILAIGLNERILLHAIPITLDYSRLRRAQALAALTESGVDIARFLIDAKLRNQGATLNRLDRNVSPVETIRNRLHVCRNINSIRDLEAQAAAYYWQTLSDVPVRFARRELKYIPDHWLTFGGRGSALTGMPRNATNPANAMLNYAYTVLEGETCLMLTKHGLDPGIGLMHADGRNRNAMAYDAMEPGRPLIDHWLVEYLNHSVFKRDDFWYDRRGAVRLSLDLRREITKNVGHFDHVIAPYVEQIAELLVEHPLPASLTWERKGKMKDDKPTMKATARCTICGTSIENNRTVCNECLPHAKTDGIAYAHAALATLRESGEDPAHTPEANRQRSMKNTEHRRRNIGFEGNNIDYEREIAPHVGAMTAANIARATGLSEPYASMIRRGYIPHPRHWATLRGMLDHGG